MELLGVTASVVGIIGFTVKGLKVVNELREFCKGYSSEETVDFLHDLDTSATILVEVKVLCQRVQDQFPKRSSDFRIASLQVQVEDCTKDLWQMLDAAKRRSGSRKRLRAFKEFLSAISKDHQNGHRERFRTHQGNMKTALAITGRYLDIENSARLRMIDNGVQQLARHLSDDIQERNEALESLSSSGSALLALSRTTSDRLQDVQCSTEDISAELKNMKILLLEALSNSSSALSSACSRRKSKDSSRDWQEIPEQGSVKASKTDSGRIIPIPRDSEKHIAPADDISKTEDGQQKTSEKLEPEFSMVVRASKHLVKTVNRMYHPFLADYACSLYAWHTNDICARFMKLQLPTGSWDEEFGGRAAVQKVQAVRERVQTQILTLRKVCRAEGLDEDVSALDAEMGMADHVFETWEQEANSRQQDSQRLLLDTLGTPSNQKRDRLTRINEWLLQVRESHDYLIQLHRSFWYSLPTNKSSSKAALIPANWERATLKYWFLDTAAMMLEDYASSSLGGGDSEATFKPLEMNGEAFLELDQDSHEFSESEPTIDILDLPEAIGNAGSSFTSLQSLVESPAEYLEKEAVLEAQRVLEDYRD